MRKWFLLSIAVLMILVVPVMFYADLTSQSGTVIANLTVVTGGGGRFTSSTVDGIIMLESVIGVGVVSNITDNGSFSFFDTTNKTFEFGGPSVSVSVWNGTAYDPDGILILRDCALGQARCEPRFQNGTPSNTSFNRGIINVTNTGTFNISQVNFRITDTCSWINLTFSNSSNVSQYPDRELNTTFQLAWGELNNSHGNQSSFPIFLWFNLSRATSACNFESEFDVI